MILRLLRLSALLVILPLTALLSSCSSTSDSDAPTGEARRAYYNTPSYQAQQPFADNTPLISTFYDSGYEESVYSPFSFN
jgi:hypothetical protein